MNAIQTLNAFWNGFKLKAYDENSIPDNAKLPYITYEASKDDFGHTLALSASLWYYSPSWSDITAKETEIAEYIGRGGRMIGFTGGAFWIKKGTPWAQRMDDSADSMIRRMVLNYELEYMI